MKYDVVVDGWWGSTGKGKVCTSLARRYGYEAYHANNTPNAGHITHVDGVKRIWKALPSGTAISEHPCYLGPGSIISLDRLAEEIEQRDHAGMVYIHSNATLLTQEDINNERLSSSLKGVASTLQGTSAAMIRKISRQHEKLNPVTDIPEELKGKVEILPPMLWAQHMDQKGLLEVCQGTFLSIDHGDYPHTTSRNCTAAAGIAHQGLNPRDVDRTWIVLRSFPIRVGNGEGWSGPFRGCKETDWKTIAKNANMGEVETARLLEREHTTVTKRLRRVAEFDMELAAEACRINGATDIFLSFVEYWDWRAYKVQSINDIPDRIMSIVDELERKTGVAVSALGTGEDADDVVWLSKYRS